MKQVRENFLLTEDSLNLMDKFSEVLDPIFTEEFKNSTSIAILHCLINCSTIKLSEMRILKGIKSIKENKNTGRIDYELTEEVKNLIRKFSKMLKLILTEEINNGFNTETILFCLIDSFMMEEAMYMVEKRIEIRKGEKK